MTTITVLLNSAPFSLGTAKTALDVVLAAREKGYEVNLYLYVDGTWLPHIKKGKKGPFKDMLGEAIEKDVNVVSCSRCAEMRETLEDDIMDGIPLVGLFTLTDWIEESDEGVVTFR